MKKNQFHNNRGFVPASSVQAASPSQQPRAQFKELAASELYCPRCKQAMPVRERLLLVLPRGNLYDYVCKRCGESLGTKTG